MPSKSDVQFGKLAVASKFAAKEAVEAAIMEQAKYEREQHTLILEAFLLHSECVTPEQVEAIQKKMKRRVVFCEKCHGKFNVFQFRGGERFLCHKCGNRVLVPDAAQYRRSLATLVAAVDRFVSAKKGGSLVPPPPRQPERDTISVTKEDIEKARASRKASASARDKDEVKEPAPASTGPDVSPEEPAELELEGEIEAEPVEEPAPEPLAVEVPQTPEPEPAAEAEPAVAADASADAPAKKPLQKIKIKKKSAPEVKLKRKLK